MRTTIDLPDDLHRITAAIARDRGTSLSATVAELLRRAVSGGGSSPVATSVRTGLPVVTLGRVVTSDDVRALEDET